MIVVNRCVHMITFLVALALLLVQKSVSDSRFEPLQIMCEINGYMVPAIVDTGAEISVMSSSCAKRCHLLTQVDASLSGRAIGIGSSDIVGGIDALDIRIGPITFQNKVSILHQSRCDLLIGLDVLRRFKCEVSFKEKFLTLQVKNNVIRVPLLSNDVYDPLDDTRAYADTVAQPLDGDSLSSYSDEDEDIEENENENEQDYDYDDIMDKRSGYATRGGYSTPSHAQSQTRKNHMPSLFAKHHHNNKNNKNNNNNNGEMNDEYDNYGYDNEESASSSSLSDSNNDRVSMEGV